MEAIYPGGRKVYMNVNLPGRGKTRGTILPLIDLIIIELRDESPSSQENTKRYALPSHHSAGVS